MSNKFLDDTGVSDLVNSIAANIANKYATKDEIITANGGNADTLDGLHASDFKAYQRYAPIYNGDLLDMTEMGTYSCNVDDVTNIPNAISSWCYVTMMRFRDAGYRRYICIPLNSISTGANELYLASEVLKDSDGKLIWRNVSDGGNADTVDGLHADGFIKVNGHSGYDCNTLYDAGLYLCNGSATNTPNDTKYGSLLVMPYRRPYGNGIPDYCAQIFIPNGDAGIERKMYFRTSTQNSFDEWEEVYSSKNLPTNIPSPNLLINPDFKINQRGENSYTSSLVDKYTVDRWMIAGTCTQTSTGVTVSTDGSGYGYGVFEQIVENYISGQIVTVSTKVNGNVYQFTGNTSESHIGGTVIKDNNNNEVGYIRLVSVNNRNVVEFIIYEGYQMEIEWVKLEYGSVVTPFVTPDPTTELLKCKRYFEIKNKGVYGLSPNDVWIQGFMFDSPKRVIPSIKLTSSLGTQNTLSTYTGADSNIKITGMPNVKIDRIESSPCNQNIGTSLYSYTCIADAEIY